MQKNLSVFGSSVIFERSDQFTLLLFENNQVVLNLLSLDQAYKAQLLIALQEKYQLSGVYLIHLWEDVWKSKKQQVIGRIRSLLGLNTRLHGRKTRIVRVTQKEADEFLIHHHLQGTAKSKYRFGLIVNDELTVVACFSNLRYMKKGGPEYRSAELIRFATRTNVTVTGGFSKLIKHFIELYKPDDIMSYADRDWSLGKAYEQGGFRLAGVTPPAEIWLNLNTLERCFVHRISGNITESTIKEQYLKIFNTGNLKYLLYVQSSGKL